VTRGFGKAPHWDKLQEQVDYQQAKALIASALG